MKKQNIKQQPSTSITGNTFTGVHWDKQATEAVNNVSKAILNLTELFKSQNIKIDSMLSINKESVMDSLIEK